ncbi:unnamed protein product [Polarella glacialis]|uniref:G domain-containing protein n=1 Tax=Polarella glacialis TaxID=89957 RepID=A0A813DRB1_POLGL|nr:unnamed protein product [Polarella glacialis]CAE8697414.1 unnamed protein product [Polarella glacialis]
MICGLGTSVRAKRWRCDFWHADTLASVRLLHSSCLRQSRDPRQKLVSVMIGPSQSGKSTFLSMLHGMYGLPVPPQLEVGFGNESTTRVTASYFLPVQYLTWTSPVGTGKIACDSSMPRDHEDYSDKFCAIPNYVATWTSPAGTGKIACDSSMPRDHEDYIDKFCANSHYVANVQPRTDAAELYSWEIIDTPGFDDTTKHLDERHQFEVLKSLQTARTVNAFVFVVGKGIHFGNAFKRIFTQYWATFDRFHDRFLIVHTKWSPLEENYDNECKERVDAFNRNFPQAVDLQHFFVDCQFGSAKRSFPEQKKAFAAERINCVLDAVSARLPTCTSLLACCKTDHMKNVDAILTAHLEGQIDAANTAFTIADNKHAKAKQAPFEIIALLAQKQAEVKDIVDNLTSMDTKDLLIGGSDTKSFVGYWFTGSSTEIRVSCKHTVRGHKETINPNYTYAKWDNIYYPGTTVTGTLHSPWFTGYAGGLYAYVYSCDVHQVEIAKLKERHANLTKEVESLVERRNILQRDMQELGQEWTDLKSRIELLGKRCGELKATHLPLEEFLVFHDVYKRPPETPAKELFRMYCIRKDGKDM